MIKRAVSIICVPAILLLPTGSYAAESLARKVMVDAIYGAGIGVTVGFANGFARAVPPGESYNPRRQAGDMIGGLVIGAVIGAAYGLVTGLRGGGPQVPPVSPPEAPEETADNIPKIEENKSDVKDLSAPWAVEKIDGRAVIKEAVVTK